MYKLANSTARVSPRECSSGGQLFSTSCYLDFNDDKRDSSFCSFPTSHHHQWAELSRTTDGNRFFTTINVTLYAFLKTRNWSPLASACGQPVGKSRLTVSSEMYEPRPQPNRGKLGLAEWFESFPVKLTSSLSMSYMLLLLLRAWHKKWNNIRFLSRVEHKQDCSVHPSWSLLPKS